jgi:hypothetical protein
MRIVKEGAEDRWFTDSTKPWYSDTIEIKNTIVCLCGSTRFAKAFQDAQLYETLAGKIVLTIGCNMKTDFIFGQMPEDEKVTIKIKLDELHLRKIDLADEVLILNVGGYIGESTARELAYAKSQGKIIRYLEPV